MQQYWAQPLLFGWCRFLAGSSDSESDDERRVVKSAKDKSLGELAGCSDEIRVGHVLWMINRYLWHSSDMEQLWFSGVCPLVTDGAFCRFCRTR